MLLLAGCGPGGRDGGHLTATAADEDTERPAGAAACDLAGVVNPGKDRLIADLSCHRIYVAPPGRGRAAVSGYTPVGDGAVCDEAFELQERSEPELAAMAALRLEMSRRFDELMVAVDHADLAAATEISACPGLTAVADDWRHVNELQAAFETVLSEIRILEEELAACDQPECVENRTREIQDRQIRRQDLAGRIDRIATFNPNALAICAQAMDRRRVAATSMKAAADVYLGLGSRLIAGKAERLRRYKALMHAVGGRLDLGVAVDWQARIETLRARNAGAPFTFAPLPLTGQRLDGAMPTGSSSHDAGDRMLPAVLGYETESLPLRADAQAGPVQPVRLLLSRAAACALGHGERPRPEMFAIHYYWADHGQPLAVEVSYDLALVHHALRLAAHDGFLTRDNLLAAATTWRESGAVTIEATVGAPAELPADQVRKTGESLFIRLAHQVLGRTARAVAGGVWPRLPRSSPAVGLDDETRSFLDGLMPCPTGTLDCEQIFEFINPDPAAHAAELSGRRRLPAGSILPTWRSGQVVITGT